MAMSVSGKAMSTKSEGFTKLPHGFHTRIGEFKDDKSYARLAVWLYHRCREGKSGDSYPSVPRMAKDLKLDDKTVTAARAWLKKNGWLTKTGEVESKAGKFSVPKMMTDVPTPINGSGDHTHSVGTDALQSMGMDGTQSIVAGSTGAEVVPSLEVDPKPVEPQEEEHRQSGEAGSQATASSIGLALLSAEQVLGLAGVKHLVEVDGWSLSESEQLSLVSLSQDFLFPDVMLWFAARCDWKGKRVKDFSKLALFYQTLRDRYTRWLDRAAEKENFNIHEQADWLQSVLDAYREQKAVMDEIKARDMAPAVPPATDSGTQTEFNMSDEAQPAEGSAKPFNMDDNDDELPAVNLIIECADCGSSEIYEDAYCRPCHNKRREMEFQVHHFLSTLKEGLDWNGLSPLAARAMIAECEGIDPIILLKWASGLKDAKSQLQEKLGIVDGQTLQNKWPALVERGKKTFMENGLSEAEFNAAVEKRYRKAFNRDWIRAAFED
jgi:hypothetical protein